MQRHQQKLVHNQQNMEARPMTKMTARLMPVAVSIFFDTPMKGQMPKNFCMKFSTSMAPSAIERFR